MFIAKVLENVDAWQPNNFSVSDKLRWCYEVTADLLTECPVFRSCVVRVPYDGAVIPLPEGVVFSQVARVYVNGKMQEIRDERTFEDVTWKKGDEVYIAYRAVPEEYALDDTGAVPENLETVCPAPYDSMYMDYVCAQIALQQNDLNDYNKFINTFNVRFDAYKKFYGSNSPISDRKNFVNLY